jgi:hypothetical protein
MRLTWQERLTAPFVILGAFCSLAGARVWRTLRKEWAQHDGTLNYLGVWPEDRP